MDSTKSQGSLCKCLFYRREWAWKINLQWHDIEILVLPRTALLNRTQQKNGREGNRTNFVTDVATGKISPKTTSVNSVFGWNDKTPTNFSSALMVQYVVNSGRLINASWHRRKHCVSIYSSDFIKVRVCQICVSNFHGYNTVLDSLDLAIRLLIHICVKI